MKGLDSIDVDSFSLPNLPLRPNSFRGFRKKSSSLRHWLSICSELLMILPRGESTPVQQILRKYFGDFIIACYQDCMDNSGYDTHIQKIEKEVIVKSLNCFKRDHLINMNRLSSAVNVRSFGYIIPLEEYKIDGCRFFIFMLSASRRLTIQFLINLWSKNVVSEEIFISQVLILGL